MFASSKLCSAVPTCVQLPELVNGDLSLSDDVNEGSVATYICDEGFTLTGSVNRTCTRDGGWTPTAPICLRISKSTLAVQLATVIDLCNLYHSRLWSPLLPSQW